MANLSIRVSDDLLARFDACAGGQGGRAPALRHLMDQAAAGPPSPGGRLPARPLKLTVRLPADDGTGLAREAAAMGLTPNGWAAVLIRHRLRGKPYDNPQAWSGKLFDHPGGFDGIAYNARHDDEALCYGLFERGNQPLSLLKWRALARVLRASARGARQIVGV